jgi:peroxiredoxin
MAQRTPYLSAGAFCAGLATLLALSSCAPHTTAREAATPTVQTSAPAPGVPALTDQLRSAGLDIPTKELAAADFTLKSVFGGSVSLSSFRGKVVLLSFWATWCGPCKQEMPAMQKLYDKMKSRGLVIVAVDVGEDTETVAAFLKKAGYTFPVLLDSTGAIAGTSLYAASAIPTNYLIDRKGNIVGRKIGIDGPEWTSVERTALFETLLGP